jgi:hypothetical protein
MLAEIEMRIKELLEKEDLGKLGSNKEWYHC